MTDKEEKLKTLEEMGFSHERAIKALEIHPENMEQAVEYLSKEEEPKKFAKSWICTDTGKQFRSLEAAQRYATRTGNMNFEEQDIEIPPLTEEEKKEKIAALRKRMHERRVERENQEKIDKIAKEKTRRRQGQEMVEIRENMEKQKRKNEIELRKKEKKEKEEYRQKLREEVAKDKGNRAADKAAKEGKDSNKAYHEAFNAYLSQFNKKAEEKTPSERLDQVISAIEVLLDHKTTILQTLHKLVSNIQKDKSNPKFKKIKISNPAFHKRVGKFRSGLAFLRVVGFEEKDEEGTKFYILSDENINEEVINLALEKLSEALGL